MKKLFFFIAACAFLFSCDTAKSPPQDSASKWNAGDIKGNVKSIIATNTRYAIADEVATPDELRPDVVLEVYNKKGQLSESRWYDGDSVLQQRMLFSYDAEGLLTRNDYIDYSKETGTADSSYFLLTYDNGMPVTEQKYTNGQLAGQAATAYNDNGDIALYQSFKDGVMLCESRYEYVYDDSLRKVEVKVFTDGALTLTMSWVYDDKGRTLGVKTKDGKVTFSETYQYDNKGRLTQETLTHHDTGKKRVASYVYDCYGNMVEYLLRTEADELLRCCSYTYDPRGNWIRSVEEYGPIRMVCERKIEYYD